MHAEPDLDRLIDATNQFAAVDLPDWLDSLTDDPFLTLPEAAEMCAGLMAKVKHVREVLLAAQLDMREFIADRARSQGAAGDGTRVAGAPGSTGAPPAGFSSSRTCGG